MREGTRVNEERENFICYFDGFYAASASFIYEILCFLLLKNGMLIQRGILAYIFHN